MNWASIMFKSLWGILYIFKFAFNLQGMYSDSYLMDDTDVSSDCKGMASK